MKKGCADRCLLCSIACMVEVEASALPPRKRARMSAQRVCEADVGLLAYVHAGWHPAHAIIKQRYADFIVHELLPSGEVVRITSLEPPSQHAWRTPQQVDASWDDLQPYFGERVSDLQRAQDDDVVVDSCPLADKSDRARIHRLIRALAGDALVSETISVSDGSAVRVKRAQAAHRRARDDPDSEAAAAPPYIHFTLQKTNRDSQEALQWLARFLRLDGRGRGRGRSASANALSVAGTKDKRAVTVQRVALQRGRKTLREVWDQLNHIGQPVTSAPGEQRRRSVHDALTTRAERGLRVAHLAYADAPLQFGMLAGNHFTITLRDVRWASAADGDLRECLESHVHALSADGFVNYFGMQRFGTGVISTHQVGIAVLQNNFHEALRLVLESGGDDGDDGDDGNADDDGAPPSVAATRQAQAAIREQRYDDAYRLMPKKGVAERAVLERMRMPSWGANDALGAFQNIPRSLRLMYVHAYQSYLWNRLVSARIERFGARAPVVGDLVQHDDGSVHVLEDDSVAAYTMDDVVMPMPGSDVHLPADGWLAHMYADMLREDGLAPAALSSSAQPEYRLKGAYRKVLQKPRDLAHELITYSDPHAPLCMTDEEALLPKDDGGSGGSDNAGGPLLALRLSFSLPPSSYATVMLRELLRTDTSAHVHKELTKQSIA